LYRFSGGQVEKEKIAWKQEKEEKAEKKFKGICHGFGRTSWSPRLA